MMREVEGYVEMGVFEEVKWNGEQIRSNQSKRCKIPQNLEKIKSSLIHFN